MPFFRMPDGSVCHVRMAKGRSRRCTVCKFQTVQVRLRECDFLLPNGKTCDKLMCIDCAHHVGPNRDLCPEHFLHREGMTAAELDAHWAEIDDLFDRTDWPPEKRP